MAYNTDISLHDTAKVEIKLRREGLTLGRWDWLSVTLYDEQGRQLGDINIYSATGKRLTVENTIKSAEAA